MRSAFRLGAMMLACAPAFVLAQAVGGNWALTWADEFNAGQSDLNGWNYDLGHGFDGGWGNNELENYTNSTDNVHVDGGDLHITAISDGTQQYDHFTSGRIKTDTLFSQKNGLFEFKAKFPTGQGLWPAVWMMPRDSVYGGWPTSGEVDIFESVGQSSTLVQGTLHSGPIWWQDWVQTQTFEGSGLMPAGFSTHDWHTYDLTWSAGDGVNPGTFAWYVDGVQYGSRTGGWYVPAGGSPDAPFDQPFYFIVNMAVGGNYGGTPNLVAGPYDMQLDYLRAYQAAVPEPVSLLALSSGVTLLFARRKRAR